MLRAAGVDINMTGVVGMWLRKSLNEDLVLAIIVAHKCGLRVDPTELEAHFLAGGDASKVVKAAVTLDKGRIAFNVRLLGAIDLAGGDVLQIATAFVEAEGTRGRATFKEVADRFLAGEDVLASLHDGSFIPLAKSSGWILREEHGPWDAAEVAQRIAGGELSEGSSLWDPVGQEWISIEAAKKRLRGVSSDMPSN